MSVKNSIYLSESIQEYLEEVCKEYGMAKSSFVAMCINNHRQQTQALNQMSKLDDYITRFEELASKVENNQ